MWSQMHLRYPYIARPLILFGKGASEWSTIGHVVGEYENQVGTLMYSGANPATYANKAIICWQI